MTALAIYAISNSGNLKRLDRGVRYYDREVFEQGVAVGLTDHRRYYLNAGKHKWSSDAIVVYVGTTGVAMRNFDRLCRIVGTVPDDHVFAVEDSDEYIIGLYKTRESAQAAVDEGGEGYCYSLVPLND